MACKRGARGCESLAFKQHFDSGRARERGRPRPRGGRDALPARRYLRAGAARHAVSARRRFPWICALLVSLAAAPALAQSPDESDELSSEPVETIVVTASRVPLAAEQAGASFTLLDQEYLERRQALTVEELLRGTPGVAVSRSGVLGSLSQLRLRGSEANHTLILMDGIEIGDPALGGELDFSHFLAASLRRIEIVRGALSALWGSDAVGGAINLISNPGTMERSLVTHAEAGQFSTRKAGLSASSGNGEWGFQFSVDHLSSDGQNISRSGNENDGYRNNTGHLIAEFAPSNRFKLRLIARRSGSESQYDQTSFLTGLPADSDRSTRRTHTVAGLQAATSLLDGRWKHKASVTRTGSENQNSASGSLTGETSGDKTRISYQTTLLLPHLAWNAREGERSGYAEGGAPSLPATASGGVMPSITVGLEHEREDYLQRAAASPFGDPNRDLSTRASEALAEFRLDAQGDWAASAAFRYDRNRDFDDAFSWRASALKQLGAGFALHAAYGVGVKNPTFIERFGYFSNFIGNPDLVPESSRGWEIGGAFRTAGQDFSGSIAWFNDRLLDEINGFVFDPALGGFTAGNRPGVSRRRGLELQAQWNAMPQLSLAGAYTYLHADEPDAGDAMTTELRRPRHTGNLNVHYELPGRGMGVNLNLAYTGEQLDIFYPPWPNPSRRVTLDAFLLASLTATWQATPRVRWHIRAENLGDAGFEEVYGFRGPGRSIHLGVQFSLLGEAEGK